MTTQSGQSLDLNIGDLVDFHRPPAQKDESGWKGPATIKKNEPSRGLAVVEWCNEDVNVRYADLRKHMDFAGLVFGTFCPSRAVEVIESHLANTAKGIITTIGYLKESSGQAWQKATRKCPCNQL